MSHEELDNNFRYFDSATTYLEQADGIEIDSGGLTVHNGDINLENGNLRYNPRLEFFDLVASSNTMVFDSAQSVLIGTDFNPNSTRFRVSGTGNQKYEVGCATSVSGQEVFQQMGPADAAGTLSGGIKSIQKSANAWDWTLALVSYNPTDGHQNAIEIDNTGDIDMKGDVTFNGTAEFKDSASFENGIKVENGIELNSGDLNVNSGDINMHGGNIHLDSGFTIVLEGIDLNTLIDAGGGLTIMDSAPVDPTEGDMWLSPLTNDVLIWDGEYWFDFPAGGAGGGGGLTISATEPVNPAIGDMWLSPNTGEVLVWDGTFWFDFPAPSTEDARISDAQITYWDSAYGWGDHSTAGYLTSETTYTASNGVQKSANEFSMTGSYTGDFTVTGTVQATGDVKAYYNASDERLKKDITPITNAIDKVSSLNGVDFEYIASGIKSTGLIAQDVREVSPTAVYEDEEGNLGVRYQLLTGLLVEAVKELKAEIEELKKGR